MVANKRLLIDGIWCTFVEVNVPVIRVLYGHSGKADIYHHHLGEHNDKELREMAREVLAEAREGGDWNATTGEPNRASGSSVVER